MNATDPNRRRRLLAMIVFAILVLVAMVTQHARMRAGQVPSATTRRLIAEFPGLLASAVSLWLA